MTVDTFDRVRVSEPHSLFDIANQYSIDPMVWDTGLSANGTVTFMPEQASVMLSTVDGTSGNSAIIQTKNYFRYFPGRNQMTLQSFLMGPPVENAVQRVGYFDDANGAFLEQTSADMAFVIRSSVNGTPVDLRTVQSDWNLDRFDGTGPTMLTIDLTKAQLMEIDVQWMGTGVVLFGFSIGGSFYASHQGNWPNLGAEVYMATANLPLRYEVTNLDTVSEAATLQAMCGYVASEGALDTTRVAESSASNGTTGVNVSGRQPVLSLRPALTFHGMTNRALMVPDRISIVSNSATNFLAEIVLGGSLTDAAFSDVNTDISIGQFDVAATAITGGVVLHSAYMTPAHSSIDARAIMGKMSLSLNAVGDTADTISIVCSSLDGTPITVFAALNWKEYK